MIRLHDTRLKKKVMFQPRVAGQIGLYVCGVTVYDLCHVGHARFAVAFDIIVRHLRRRGFTVTYVRNVTDVDDKIIRRGLQEGKEPIEVARHYTQVMHEDLAALGVGAPDVEPRATENIQEIIAMIARLEAKGLAYAASGDVYYNVGGFSTYGGLSGQSTDDLQVGARIEPGDIKRSPLDFALWKGAKPDEPRWESPWGPGRPGWHIECSAMSHRHLGEVFDIHGGGSDLIFPHHENEVAQSEGAFGVGSFAQHWMHSGMVNFGGAKMSKSLGNVVSIRKVQETHDLEALRFLLSSVHYRSPVSFSIQTSPDGHTVFPDLDEAETRLDYFYRAIDRLDAFVAAQKAPLPEAPPSDFAQHFGEAMDDDFNTAGAIGHMYDAFVQANKLLDDAKSLPKDQRLLALLGLSRDLRDAGKTLGIMERPAAEFLLARRGRLCRKRCIDENQVETAIVDRRTARANKDFAASDAIRAELKSRGVELMDSPTGTSWRVD